MKKEDKILQEIQKLLSCIKNLKAEAPIDNEDCSDSCPETAEQEVLFLDKINEGSKFALRTHLFLELIYNAVETGSIKEAKEELDSILRIIDICEKERCK